MDFSSVTANPHFPSSLSQELFFKKEHVLLGISPFNSYFSEQMIAYWIKWAHSTFSDFNLFIPDTLPIHTFLALGYTQEKAKSKAKKQASYLKNKIIRAFSKLGFTDRDAYNLLIDMNFLEANEWYQLLKKRCYSLYKDNLFFKNECDQCTGWVLNGHTMQDINQANTNLAVHYILDEMPLLMNTPLILNKKSSLFLYHQTPQLMKYLYTNSIENEFIAKNQGFVELSVTHINQVVSNGVLIEDELRQ